jgi:hypothetical protein
VLSIWGEQNHWGHTVHIALLVSESQVQSKIMDSAQNKSQIFTLPILEMYGLYFMMESGRQGRGSPGSSPF